MFTQSSSGWWCQTCIKEHKKRWLTQCMNKVESNLWVCPHCYRGMSLFEGFPGLVLGVKPRSKLSLLMDT